MFLVLNFKFLNVIFFKFKITILIDITGHWIHAEDQWAGGEI